MSASIKRSGCVYNGQYFGIEEFITVIDGKQINKEGIIEKFRRYGRQNLLFCECGCGVNLIPVFGQKMVRSQHFRVRPQEGFVPRKECTAIYESETTKTSKIFLRHWLESALHLMPDDIRYNTTANTVFNTDRGYEYTHYIPKYNFGLCYERLGANLDAEKIYLLASLSLGRILFVTDISNGGCTGQYPEYMLKIQNSQGFCLLLDVQDGISYNSAILKVSAYVKQHNGLWRELVPIEGGLSDFSLDREMQLTFNGAVVKEVVEKAVTAFHEEQEDIVRKMKEAEQRRDETLKKQMEICELKNRLREEARIAEEKRFQLQMQREREKAEQEQVALRERLAEEKKKQIQAYFAEHPTTATLFHFLSNLTYIEGPFSCIQSDKQRKTRRENICIKSVEMDIRKGAIIIRSEEYVSFWIFLQDNANIRPQLHTVVYVDMPIYKYTSDNVVSEFCKYYHCK